MSAAPARLFLLATIVAAPLAGCSSDSPVAIVRRFNGAVDRGDLDAARALMAADARVWYENPLGPGMPWTLGEGRYAEWDEHFRTRKTMLGDYQRDGDWVWLVVDETNDYYLLTERPWARTYLAWRVNSRDRVDGLLVAQVGEPPSRYPEFRAWAQVHEPAEFEYLVPDGRLDPTGDRPQRMRALLERWRAAENLPPRAGARRCDAPPTGAPPASSDTTWSTDFGKMNRR